MKKIISLLLILLLLCSCASVSLDDSVNKLNTFFDNYVYSTSAHGTNNNTKYYNFYLPSDIQEIEYDDSYHHLIFNSSDFAMNLNINYILCDKLFSKTPDDPFAFLSTFAVYEYDNFKNEEMEKYKFCLYEIEDKYFFSLYTNKLCFFGKTDLNELEELVNHLFMLNNSTKIDYDKIIDSYYLGTTIDFTQKGFDLFNNYVSSSGLLSDLVKDVDETSEQENVDSQASEDTNNNE